VGGFNVGACKFEESRARFGRFRTGTQPAINFQEDADGTLWVGTYHGGLYKFEFGAQRVTHYTSLGTPHSEGAIDLAGTWISAVHRDKKGTLWLATRGLGLVAFDTTNETYRQYMPDPNDDASLPVDSIWALNEDDGGVLWLGTNGGGLVKFDPAKTEFTAYTTADSIGLSSDVILSLYRDPTARAVLWLGTAQGGVVKFDSVANTAQAFRHKAEDPTSIGNDDILGMHRDANGMLWLATSGGGLNKLDPSTGKAVRFTTTNSKLFCPMPTATCG
jgi:ligand-binding sensor domain-containing protein